MDCETFLNDLKDGVGAFWHTPHLQTVSFSRFSYCATPFESTIDETNYRVILKALWENASDDFGIDTKDRIAVKIYGKDGRFTKGFEIMAEFHQQLFDHPILDEQLFAELKQEWIDEAIELRRNEAAGLLHDGTIEEITDAVGDYGDVKEIMALERDLAIEQLARAIAESCFHDE